MESSFHYSHPVGVSDTKAGAGLLDIILMKVIGEADFQRNRDLEKIVIHLFILSVWWVEAQMGRGGKVAFQNLRQSRPPGASMAEISQGILTDILDEEWMRDSFLDDEIQLPLVVDRPDDAEDSKLQLPPLVDRPDDAED
ncbi:hypothetical protein Pint_31722 [Pistacia integerrima]|uniref:Uncharacterized protein n=1 Tax=Pistacia integerrima TaxID=434235 RepID=A0ACC0XNF8_9ROSI|nr:hypothetical protein Pint_31722 [Pistacia integerrima]